MTLTIVYSIAEIFGMFCIGWLARHFGRLRESELNLWSRFVVDFLTPALVFHSVVTGMDIGRLRELWMLPVMGFGLMAVGAAAGFVLRWPLRSQSRDLVKTFHHFCAVNNYGFLPVIILRNLWGAQALAGLFVFNLGSELAYWTIGVGLLGGSRDLGSRLKHMLSMPLCALTLALALVLTGVNHAVPNIVIQITDSAGSAAVPLMMILIGAGMYPFPSIKNKLALGYLTLVRLIVLPALLVLGLKLLPLPEEALRIGYVEALMPVALSSTIMTRRFGGDPHFAAAAGVITTLFALVTIPLGLSLLLP